jgi:hypothetical protein
LQRRDLFQFETFPSCNFASRAPEFLALPLAIDDQQTQEKSRVAGLRLVLLSLRLMEYWKHSVDDYDRAMILISVAAISAERLLRSMDGPYEALSAVVPPERLAKCNVSSIASATGLNRETTRRKVESLIAEGLLVRMDDGSLTFTPGVMQQDSTFALVRKQLETIVKTANDLIRDDILKVV